MQNKVYNVISIIFGLFMVNAGLDKFLHYMPMPESMPESLQHYMQAFTSVSWFMPLVGAAELIGGILVIIPKTRALGAVVLFPVMVGIVFTNSCSDNTSGLLMSLGFMAVELYIVYMNRAKYRPMVEG